MPAGRPTIQVSRWVQRVRLPVPALLAWALASTLGHAVFLFLTAAVVALIAALVTVAEQARSAADRADTQLTSERGRSGDSGFGRDVAAGLVP